MKKHPWFTLGLCALSLLMMLPDATIQEVFHFDRPRILAGEGWRLITGHLSHAGLAHLAWNLSALLILGTVLERRSRPVLVASLLAGMVSINLWLFTPWAGIDRYCGLSGVLNGLFVAALWQGWQHTRSNWLLLTGLLFATKLIGELARQTSLLTHMAWPPYPPAHLVGAMAGLVVVWFDYLRVSKLHDRTEQK